MTIDNGTGLPEVPEGYSWRIKHPDWRNFGLDVVDEKQIVIQLVQKIHKLVKVEVPGSWYWPFNKKVDKTKPFARVFGERYLGKTPSPESILEAATEIMTDFNNRNRMLSYIGIYPPKKLEN